ncbi:MAG: NDP-hexose 2,3-dehydratase family protein, partial [Mogibacterium sp.]|nr:NDP-hexose 2,3-dehydratase family protein [Mogibacterium sp.]
FKAAGIATFGLLCRDHEGRTEYLIRLKPEIGCFDMAEMGPTVQWEPTHDATGDTEIDRLFREKASSKDGTITDVILSEEGGRFYHEQNRNLIIKIKEEELPEIPDDYAWADLASLSRMIRSGGDLNIQLRNLVSLIDL